MRQPRHAGQPIRVSSRSEVPMRRRSGFWTERPHPAGHHPLKSIRGITMQLHAGFELKYLLPQDTPMILVVNVHSSRAADLVVPDALVTEPSVPIGRYEDRFGNQCVRLLAP